MYLRLFPQVYNRSICECMWVSSVSGLFSSATNIVSIFVWAVFKGPIAPGGFKIGESGLRADEQKLHRPPSRIINVNEHITDRTTTLESAMLTAVNLDEFSSASTAQVWLMYTWRP